MKTYIINDKTKDMKLELKHLAPYLPYGLKCHCAGLWIDDDGCKPITVVIEGLNTEMVEIHEIGRTITEEYHYIDVFPILHPLSDLTKENYPGIWNVYNLGLWPSESFQIIEKDISTSSYEFVQELVKNHFDVFGLIKAGLAIDINTL